MDQKADYKVRGSLYSVVFVLIALQAILLPFGFGAKAGDLEYGGIVRGKVVRGSEPLPNIKVTLEDPDLQQQYEPVFTNRLGVFVLTGVRPGKYKLLIWPPGGEPSKSEIIAGPDITDLPSIDLTGVKDVVVASPSPTTTVFGNSITSDEARKFVKSFWAAKEKGDLDGVVAAFAPKVHYYDDGTLNRDAIRKDQANYLRYYPERTFELGAIDVIKGKAANSDNNGEAVRLRFSYRYRLSGNKRASGKYLEDWLLQKIDGQLQIVECKGKAWRE